MLRVSTGAVANFLKAAINGLKVGKYREAGDDYDIVIRLPCENRLRLEDIHALTVANADGRPVPLSAVARLQYTSGLAAIRRVDEKRTITVFSEVAPDYNSNQILRQAEQRLRTLNLPPGYAISFTGEKEEQLKAQGFLLKAGVVAVLLIFLILVTEFNSALLPFLIMVSVLLSWIGVFAGLTITNQPFGVIMTGLGVISLAGVVVNNAIVLIDYVEKLRRRGIPLPDAVVRAGAVRLRPVLLTSVTTILAMLPVVFGVNVDLRSLQFHPKSESAVWWGPCLLYTSPSPRDS